uniref:Uncharacterized protein n=1 Tax=Rhizophora mucronata TaxID=61149 RepID=A0A2P2J0S8_RHIMU
MSVISCTNEEMFNQKFSLLGPKIDSQVDLKQQPIKNNRLGQRQGVKNVVS